MPANHQKKRNRPRNWFPVRRRYVEGDFTAEELAAEEHTKPATVRAHMAREHWLRERDEFRASVAAAASKTSFEERVKIEEARLKAQALLDQDAKAIGTLAMDSLAACLPEERDPSKIRAATAALVSTYRLLRETNGLPAKKSPPPDPTPRPRGIPTVTFLNSKGEAVYLDPVTGKDVDPTPDAIPIARSACRMFFHGAGRGLAAASGAGCSQHAVFGCSKLLKVAATKFTRP